MTIQSSENREHRLSRRELYKRSKGHAADWMITLPAIFLIGAFLILGYRELPFTLLVGGFVLLLVCLPNLYSKTVYFLDIFCRATEVFEGPVSVVPAYQTKEYCVSNWQAPYQMTVVLEKTERGKPKRFIMSATALQAELANHPFSPGIEQESVAFRYLKRSKCIVELLGAERPVEPAACLSHPPREKRKADGK